MTFDKTVKLENEVERTYVYGDADIHVPEPTELSWNTSDPDRHYLRSKRGLFLITPGWRGIVINAPDWELPD